MLSQKIACWPSLVSDASRIGSRQTGQITGRSFNEFEGRFSSSGLEGSRLSLNELKGRFFFLLRDCLVHTPHVWTS